MLSGDRQAATVVGHETKHRFHQLELLCCLTYFRLLCRQEPPRIIPLFSTRKKPGCYQQVQYQVLIKPFPRLKTRPKVWNAHAEQKKINTGDSYMSALDRAELVPEAANVLREQGQLEMADILDNTTEGSRKVKRLCAKIEQFAEGIEYFLLFFRDQISISISTDGCVFGTWRWAVFLFIYDVPSKLNLWMRTISTARFSCLRANVRHFLGYSVDCWILSRWQSSSKRACYSIIVHLIFSLFPPRSHC